MQVFVPYPSIEQTVACLDYKRLGKQRVEAWQILGAITAPTEQGWTRHACVEMWRDAAAFLTNYYDACLTEWQRRGYKNTLPYFNLPPAPPPLWWGDPVVHSSHRSQLLSKAPDYYSQFGWTDTPGSPYAWVVGSEAHATRVGFPRGSYYAIIGGKRQVYLLPS